MSNAINLPHKCPNKDCETIAKTAQELLDKFGIRETGGKASSQSWCKKCR